MYQYRQHRFIMEMAQDSVDKILKEWNDTWFGNKVEIKEDKDNVPDFLKR